MESDFDLADLLSSSSGREELIHGGNPYFMKISNISTNGIVTMKTVKNKELKVLESDSVPLGYETSVEYKGIEQEIVIENRNTGIDFILSEYKFLPNIATQLPSYSLYSEDSYNAVGVVLKRGTNCSLTLRVVLPDNFEGQYGKWLLLSFEGRCNTTKTSTTIKKFIMGVQITGCVTSNISKNQLSSEAKPFIPMAKQNYFDQQVTICIQLCSITHEFYASTLKSSLQILIIYFPRVMQIHIGSA
jgi:hypothetical protein